MAFSSLDDPQEEVASRPYSRANAGWPEEIPPLTRIEAERAALRLYRKFRPQARNLERIRVRRCWIAATPPYDQLDRGWRRLVHDISHCIHHMRHPSLRPHDGRHAYLEAEMVAYVVGSGWLQGKLRPKVRQQAPAPERRYRAILVRQQAWERKLKRAQTALKKLRRQRSYYEKRLNARSAG